MSQAPFVTNKPSISYPVGAKPELHFGAARLVEKFRGFRLRFAARVSDRALSDFFDHLATLLASGIPMLRALELGRASTSNQVLLAAIERIARKVREGCVLSEALQGEAAIL